MRVDASWWHIANAEQSLTRCGLVLSRGSERRPFERDTPTLPLRYLHQSVRRGQRPRQPIKQGIKNDLNNRFAPPTRLGALERAPSGCRPP